ncbi:hypothetical protein [Niveibacterium umoris]|nr:hypothetical protein [Niveibacterium umoris]
MGLFDWLRKREEATPGAEAVAPQLVREATDYLVRQTDPRLALCARHYERLAPGIEATIRHIVTGVRSLPEPCDAHPEHWASSPELAAFFVSADDLTTAFSRSEPLQRLFDDNPVLDVAYATLATTLIERKGLGMAMEGEILRRDVVQTSVSFTNPRVQLVASEPDELRRAIAYRMFEELAMVALERIEALRSERKQLSDDRALLQTRLQMLHGHGTGFDVQHVEDADGLQARMEENTRALAAAGAGVDALERELDVVIGVLQSSADLVTIHQRTMRLTAMNLLVEGQSSEAVREIRFGCAHAERIRPLTRAVLLVRYPRSGMRKVTMSFAEASRLPI